MNERVKSKIGEEAEVFFKGGEKEWQDIGMPFAGNFFSYLDGFADSLGFI